MTFPIAIPDIQIYSGDTFEQSYTFKDTAGEVIDLVAAGYTEWKAQYRPSRDAIEYVDFAVVHTDADEGVVVIKLTHEQTSTISKPGVWDLKAKNGTKWRTFVASNVDVEKSVTHV